MNHKTLSMILFAVFLTGCNEKIFEKNILLNDVHSKLNATTVAELYYPESTDDVIKIIKHAKKNNQAISISGGRHAMGGQQFGEGTVHISMKKMNDVLAFDREKGIITIEAGIEWPQLINYLVTKQENTWPQWGIVQKQTGGDHLSVGGSM